jgi:hypothetical protein
MQFTSGARPRCEMRHTPLNAHWLRDHRKGSRLPLGCSKSASVPPSGSGLMRTGPVKGVVDRLTKQGGIYIAASVGTAILGHGADEYLIDDPFDTMADARSETVRDSVWEWYNGTVYNQGLLRADSFRSTGAPQRGGCVGAAGRGETPATGGEAYSALAIVVCRLWRGLRSFPKRHV